MVWETLGEGYGNVWTSMRVWFGVAVVYFAAQRDFPSTLAI